MVRLALHSGAERMVMRALRRWLDALFGSMSVSDALRRDLRSSNYRAGKRGWRIAHRPSRRQRAASGDVYVPPVYGSDGGGFSGGDGGGDCG